MQRKFVEKGERNVDSNNLNCSRAAYANTCESFLFLFLKALYFTSIGLSKKNNLGLEIWTYNIMMVLQSESPKNLIWLQEDE